MNDNNTTNTQPNIEEIESLDSSSLSAADVASLEETFAAIEHKRKKFYQLFLILLGIMVVGSVFYIILFQYDIIVYLFISGLIVFFILKLQFDQYKKFYKSNMEDICLKKTFRDVINRPDMGMDQDVVFGTNILFKGNIYKSKNYICAKYDNTTFACADVLVEDENKELQSKITYFKGQWYVFQLDHSVNENLYLADKWFGIKEIQPDSSGNKIYKKVVAQDESFAKHYDIFAKSQEIGNAFLNTDLVKIVNDFDEKTKARFIICLIEDRIHIGFNKDKAKKFINFFEPINYETEKEKFLDDINHVRGLVDQINGLFK